MGSSESKLKSNDEKGRISNKSDPSTPTKADSNSENFSHLDPRSPSEEIFRTPIEISKEKDGKAASVMKGVIDPRSPTDQFDRTPIVVKESNSDYPTKLHNKILDNARRNITYSPVSSKTESNPNSQKFIASPPKLISSIPSLKKCNEKRKSFVGLLETNIDFTETNLDEIVRNKSLDQSLSISINEGPICNIVEHKNCDPRSPSKDFLRTPIQIVQKVGEVDINETVEKCELPKIVNNLGCRNSDSLLKLVDNRSLIVPEECELETLTHTEEIVPHALNPDDNEKVTTKDAEQIEKSDINICAPEDNISVLSCVNDVPKDSAMVINVEKTEQKMAEIVEDLIGNISILTTDETKVVVPYVDNLELKEPIIDLTADVQEFGEKLTKIIHENNENFSFKKIIAKEYLDDKPKKRTPMKDRNQISEPKRNKLKVSDKPRKLSYDISKIPVFRDRNGIKIKSQCENTPPTDMDVRNRKKSHPRWDSDKTMVI